MTTRSGGGGKDASAGGVGSGAPYVNYSRFGEERKLEVDDSDLLDFDKDLLPEADSVTTETPIPATNIGYKLAQKMGWVTGTGLGKEGKGRVDPIPFGNKMDFLGVGKSEEEEARHKETTARRKLLDSEVEETEDLKKKREEEAKKEEEIKKNLQEINKVFYCELCAKQYTKAMEYENHLRSYDHGHKQRLKEMQESMGSKEISKNKKKEQKKRRSRDAENQ